MNENDTSIISMMPLNTSVEEEIRRIQDTPSGNILYIVSLFDSSKLNLCETILKKSEASYSLENDDNSYSVIYRKL